MDGTALGNYTVSASGGAAEDFGNGLYSIALPSTSMTPLLDAHNAYRRTHSVPEVQWDNTVAASADAYASKCIWQTDAANTVFGETLYVGGGDGFDENKAVAAATKSWYDELYTPGYSFATPEVVGGAGRFTQVVWKSTIKLGCSVRLCPNGLQNLNQGLNRYYVVCRYSPAGNVAGQFAANVLPATVPEVPGEENDPIP